MNPVQQLGFAITLPHNGFESELGGLTLDQSDQLVVGGAAIDGGLAPAQPAQVGAVDHVHDQFAHGAQTPA
ncbi:Uncharacterised protein [Mycobacterium tuberculosis]|nr:Uncharacterised protein [Mycobacterium tuberculosis]